MRLFQATPSEYDAARAGATVASRSDCGRLSMEGKDRVTHLHRLSTNEVRGIEPPAGLTTVLTTEKGRIKDLVTALFRPDAILIVTSPSRGEEVRRWLERFVIREKVTIRDLSGELFFQTILGPLAVDATRIALGIDLGPLPAWHHATGAGIIAYKGESYLGSPCVNVLGPMAEEPAIRASLSSAGVHALSAEGFEAIRIESGIPGPAELTEERNPWEARLDGSINLDKGCYIGQEVVARLDTYKKVHRSLCRLRFIEDPALPPSGPLTVTRDGRDVGQVTSLARIVPQGKTLGLAYVEGTLLDEGQEVLAGNARALVEPLAGDVFLSPR